MRSARSRPRGFTFIELVVTLALLGVVAMSTLPLYGVVSTRMKEAELRQDLRVLRAALDAYKAAVDGGQIPRAPNDSGYPPSLELLVQGVEVSPPGALNADGTPAVKRLVFLRSVPRDPFHPDTSVPAAATWATRAYGSPPDAPSSGPDVFDVASTSPRTGSNGIPYSQW